jgi:hypothetical protein
MKTHAQRRTKEGIMSSDERRNRAGEERVGYGRPPVSSRFKPGQCGNRKGRPKGALGRRKIVQKVAGEKHQVIERGQPRRRSLFDLVTLVISRAAAAGDPRAVRAADNLLARFGPQESIKPAGYLLIPEPISPAEWEKESEKLHWPRHGDGDPNNPD